MEKYVSTDKIIAIIGIEEFKRFQCDRKNVAVISIQEPDVDSLDNSFYEGFASFLQIKFWDLEEDYKEYKTLSDEDGASIRTFIEQNKDKEFLIHCKAGISRSAGVGCAIEFLCEHNDIDYASFLKKSKVFNFWRYKPNLTVFKKVVEAQ